MLINLFVFFATLFPLQLTTQTPTSTTVIQPSHPIQHLQIHPKEELKACGNSNNRKKGCGGSGRREILS